MADERLSDAELRDAAEWFGNTFLGRMARELLAWRQAAKYLGHTYSHFGDKCAVFRMPNAPCTCGFDSLPESVKGVGNG